MANTVQLKRSAVADKVPGTSDLALGEIAINTNDGKVYTKMDHGHEHIVDVTGQMHNGFAHDTGRTHSELLFNEATRTVTIQPKAPNTSYVVYWKSVIFKKTVAETYQIPDVEGNHFVYFNETGTLTSATSIPEFSNMIFVAYIYWDATNKKAIIFGDERHSAAVDEQLHSYLHRTFGTRYDSGFAISGYTLSTQSDAAVTFGLSNGTIWDEDLRHDVISTLTPTGDFQQNLVDPAQLPIFYREGASGFWRKTTPNNYAYRNAVGGSNRIAFNVDGGTWGQQEASNGNFVAYFIVATNDIFDPIISIQGQREDTSLNNAVQNATWNNLAWGTFPFQEMKVLFRIIVQTGTAYSGTTKSRIELVEDLRTSQFAGTSATSGADHGGLSGLSDPDHPALAIYTDVSQFNKILSAGDTTVQLALNTIDEHSHTLDGLSDVVITTPSTGQVIKYNGTNWVNDTDSTSGGTTNIDDLGDVTITSPSTDQVLKYNGSTWVNSSVPAPSVNLDGLTDVIITTPSNNQFLRYNGSAWVNTTYTPPTSALDDLSDVVINTPVVGNFLRYNGTNWVNTPVFQQRTESYAANLTLDCSLGSTFDVTLTGNIVLSFSNAYDGQKIVVRLKQDATGSRTITYGAMVRFGTDITGTTLTTTASKTDQIGLVYNLADNKYDLVAFVKGY